MAINDVKKYYYTMLSQYLEEKQNLEDFSDALKEGMITEEQMQEAMSTVKSLEDNYYRLTYIMFLLNMPTKVKKKAIYIKQYKKILDELVRLGVDEKSIKEENSDALVHFRAALKALKSKDE